MTQDETSATQEQALYYPPENIVKNAYIRGTAEYERLYRQSLDDPDAFWGEQAEQFHWNKKWENPVLKYNFNPKDGEVFVKWFEEAETNICYNCVDRHVEAGLGDRVCFFWEGNETGDQSVTTYKELQSLVCKLANYLKSLGIGKGDDVTIYMPLVPELPAIMLACARIGAIHSVVFGGFSDEALAGRIRDSKPKLVVTAGAGKRGAKPIFLKAIVDSALDMCANANGKDADEAVVVPNVLVLDHQPGEPDRANIPMREGRDFWLQDAIADLSDECPITWVEAEHPLFKLYTSGSTGKPKGVQHSTGGYMVGSALTTKYVFDVKPESDVYWCTADCGWITGHSYVTYGPLLLGATQVIFEGMPTYPDAGRCWEIVDKYKVSIFYTAPTAIRALNAKGDAYVTKHSRASLRLLGSVGEPINPEAWKWFYGVIGDSRCPIMDTWWQTETGSHLITPLPGVTALKPGSATLPFFGVEAAIVDEKGQELEGACEGILVIKRPWPSMMRTVAGDHARFEQIYFGAFPGKYFAGDGARRDEDGYYWITGRVDDVINVSGHRIGTAEVESALTGHKACAEAAVIGVEHPIKGQGLYAFVTLKAGVQASQQIRKELIAHVRNTIGAFAAPDVIHWAPALPKTRSGKIMRRVLRKIATKEEKELGDVSTLAEPGVVQQLVDLRGK
uniref:acetate--CoA ligase n=2 Tax=Polytomella parva TaxID=51329 RepID=A0A7S0USI9_9CHLO|mmetsp:Transcript_16429/g.29657  ORF Transcript_16429/g.29657 Transcript_16429/m.29657 type:complete len:676 (+) Transcript_16429:149-2176(+)